MAQVSESRHGMWSSGWVFVAALVGVAIGSGNLWGFASLAANHGGGAFVLVYVLCVLLIGAPAMLAEVVIGRAGRLSPVSSARRLTLVNERNTAWIGAGWFGTYAGMLVLSYLGVFAGWALHYIGVMASASLSGADVAGAQAMFGEFIASPWRVVLWQSVFMAIVVYLSASGFRTLHKMIVWLVPMLLAMFIALLGYAAVNGSVMETTAIAAMPRWDELQVNGILVAVGQALFTIGVGIGVVMLFGSYLPARVPLVRSVAFVVLLDVVLTIAGGVIVLSIAGADDVALAQSPELIFVHVPLAFAQLPLGAAFGALLFVLIALAALVAAVGLFDPVLAYLVEEYNAKRSRAAVSFGIIAWGIGLGSALSFNYFADARFLGERSFFESVDYLVHAWLIPLGVCGIGLFSGVVLSRESQRATLQFDGGVGERLWKLMVVFVVPLAVAMTMAAAVFLSWM